MAGDVTITDRVTAQDFRNLKAVGIKVKVLLDLSHDLPKKSPGEPADEALRKPLHLDIELDFSAWADSERARKVSEFKQKFTGTYGKLRLGQFNPARKNWTAKYEAAAFGGSVVAEATNAHQLKEAIAALHAGKKGGMMEVKY